jgi:hypothetical protein
VSGMISGSVTVNPDGTWSGSGLALVLMDALQPLLLGQMPAGPSAEVVLGISNGAAVVANAAATIVGYVQANATVTIPAGSLGAGIPAGNVVLSGQPIG